jgi:hypothetical protein
MAVRCPNCARMVSPGTGVCPRCGAALVVPLRLPWLARLFWACPACGSETPLAVHQPFFGVPTISCRACGQAWTLDGDGRQLLPFDPTTKATGEPQPAEAILDALPPPLGWRPLPAPRLLLLPDETCLVQIGRARMLTPRPGAGGAQPIGRVAVVPGIYERVAVDPYGPNPASLAVAATGPFFVTDRRVVFLGDRKHVEVPLARLEGVEVDEGFLLLHRTARLDTFGFEGENAVKVRAAILAIREAEDGSRETEEGGG